MKESESRPTDSKQKPSIAEAAVRHVVNKKGSKRLLKSLQKIIRGV